MEPTDNLQHHPIHTYLRSSPGLPPNLQLGMKRSRLTERPT
jgi:hypothetical protein